MQSGLVLLERYHPRAMYKSQHNLVYKLWGQHSSRFTYCPATNASHPDTQDLSKPEERSDHNNRSWCKVMSLPHDTVHSLNIDSVCVVSIIRLYTFNDVANTDDLSYTNPALVTLSAVEINVGIMCACLPAMRPLLSLAMPKYFSDVAQYGDIAIKLDAEQLSPHKHVQTSFHLAQHNMARANKDGSFSYPSSPRPTLSRTPSGRFAVNPSRPNTAGRTAATSFISHSRSGSNVSIDIAAADARANGSRFQGRINPLRLSPITPFSPLSSRVLYPGDAYGMSSRNTSGTSSPVIWRPQTPVAAKPLPLTPFPVGGGG
jgi:hypothetical protein